ncbi:MAG: aminotransferase class IV [Desulfovibrio sp.]|nr:aminotransferase class IV [Desulfovibrio sp.]
MRELGFDEYLQSMLALPRPGAENFLGFYDHRIGAMCRDARLLLIPLDDHLCHRGDGLFESICFRQGRIFGLEAHLQRMRQGAEVLELTAPCPWEEMSRIICELCRACGVADGDLRVFLSRGPGGFGVQPSECPRAGFYVVVLRPKVHNAALYESGIRAFTSTIPPKQSYLARIKNTNYLPNVFMAREAEKKGLDVAVSFGEDGVMGEAAVANIAIVDADGRFVCPKFTHILPGTTLLAAMQLASQQMTVVQQDIRHEDLASAREVLLLTSSMLCVPVTSFDQKPVGQGELRGRPGPCARWLKERLFEELFAQGTAF